MMSRESLGGPRSFHCDAMRGVSIAYILYAVTLQRVAHFACTSVKCHFKWAVTRVVSWFFLEHCYTWPRGNGELRTAGIR